MLNLTVKHIADDGRENVIPCSEARYYPQGDGDGRKKVRLDGMDAETSHGEFDNGLVYVMNAHGATIARYNLRPAEMDRPVPPPPADTDNVLHA